MRIAVIAGGEWDARWGKKELQKTDFLVAADSGGDSALAAGRIPDLLIGDLDSISEAGLNQLRSMGVKIEKYPPEKDETDLELALVRAVAAARAAAETDIILYGAGGGRIDHFLGNVALMLKTARQGLRLILKDKQHEAWVTNGLNHIHGKPGQKISLIPLTEKAVVTTDGLVYPLKAEALWQYSPRGISNELLEKEASVEVSEGYVLVVLMFFRFEQAGDLPD